MTNAGNIVGYGFGTSLERNFVFSMLMMMPGFLPLAQLPIIKLLGGDQFRKFCVICIVILVATVLITCTSHQEEEKPRMIQRQQQGRGG
jgi:solute carrier family 45 protein 1/2/4